MALNKVLDLYYAFFIQTDLKVALTNKGHREGALRSFGFMFGDSPKVIYQFHFHE